MEYRGYLIEEMETPETEPRFWYIQKDDFMLNMFEDPQAAKEWIDEDLDD